MSKSKTAYTLFLVLISFGFTQKFTLSNSINIGYNSNPLRYSAEEIILSSKFLIFNTSLTTKANIFKRNTRFIFSAKNKYYTDIKEKSNYSLSFKVKQPLGNYQYLTFSYNYIDDIYIREYTDVDQGVLDYLYTGSDCYFDYSIVKIDYESPYIKKNYSNNKTKFNISYIYETQYYNKYFTEFDLELKGLKFKLSTNNKKNKYNFLIGFINADNVTLNDHTLSTSYMDRGYKEYHINIYYEHKLENRKRFGILLNNLHRRYTSKITEDQLHIDRKHLDSQISIWHTFFINSIKNKITVKNRERDTNSFYTWVKNLKTFDQYIIEYTVYFNTIGFK